MEGTTVTNERRITDITNMSFNLSAVFMDILEVYCR
jgi:hypothetical protein